MNILLWIIFGGIAGWLASIIVGDDQSFGIVGNVVIGVIGAFIGGYIADLIGASSKPGVERPTSVLSFVFAVIGAVVLLLVLNLLF
jgi:uncharacterized membrane protein YeaQ/YmgE (transglycosylase-associated protein family)